MCSSRWAQTTSAVSKQPGSQKQHNITMVTAWQNNATYWAGTFDSNLQILHELSHQSFPPSPPPSANQVPSSAGSLWSDQWHWLICDLCDSAVIVCDVTVRCSAGGRFELMVGNSTKKRALKRLSGFQLLTWTRFTAWKVFITAASRTWSCCSLVLKLLVLPQ